MTGSKKRRSQPLLNSKADPEPLESLPPSLWSALGLPAPRRSDDKYAPKVDRQLIRRLLDRKLSAPAVDATYRLIHAFDSWKVAYAQMVIESFHVKQTRD